MFKFKYSLIKLITIITIFCNLITDSKCNLNNENQTDNVKPNNSIITNEFAKHNNAFSINLYREISQLHNTSFIFSPFSIQITGGLLYLGANGITAETIYNGFKLISNSSDIIGESFRNVLNQFKTKNNMLKVTNGIFLSNELKLNEKFSHISKKNFNTTVQNLSFKNDDSENSKNIINQWVNHNTNGIIKYLFDENNSIDPTTKMLIVNAIHFRGQWKEKFNKIFTKKEKFFTHSDEINRVHMMFAFKNYKLGIDTNRNIVIGEFDFNEEDISLQIIMPTKRDIEIDYIEEIILTSGLKNITDNIVMKEIQGPVQIPKFINSFEVDLKIIFNRLGMQNLFTDEADFTKLLEFKKELSISKAIHKSVIEFNEDGAEAASITALDLDDRIAGGEPKFFRADQSFVYLLKGKQNEIYFMGRFNG